VIADKAWLDRGPLETVAAVLAAMTALAEDVATHPREHPRELMQAARQWLSASDAARAASAEDALRSHTSADESDE